MDRVRARNEAVLTCPTNGFLAHIGGHQHICYDLLDILNELALPPQHLCFTFPSIALTLHRLRFRGRENRYGAMTLSARGRTTGSRSRWHVRGIDGKRRSSGSQVSRAKGLL